MCPHCGHSNGNRSLQCKACTCPLPKRAKISSHESTNGGTFNNNVSSLLSDGVLPAGGEVYSVRVREQGPDYGYDINNYHN